MQEQIELFEQWQWQLHGMDCDDATPRPSIPNYQQQWQQQWQQKSSQQQSSPSGQLPQQ
jgi:hypothetical protein